MPTFRSTRKGKKCFFFVMGLHLYDHKVLHNIDRIKFFSISVGFSHVFRSYFVLQIFGVQGI